MSRRYDSRTTTFSPQGRLYQVEYAMEAISHAGAALGLLCNDGIVLVAQKLISGKLLDPQPGQSDKIYMLDDNIICVVSGITSDANILIQRARLQIQQYKYNYNEDIPVEQLIRLISDLKQSYTQYGGLRPFGVSLLYAGWDQHYGFQLYQSDPSGNFKGWKATAIGSNAVAALSKLKADYKAHDDEFMASFNIERGLEMAVQVLSKCMDSALDSEKLEFATVTRVDGQTKFTLFDAERTDALIKSVEVEKDDE